MTIRLLVLTLIACLVACSQPVDTPLPLQVILDDALAGDVVVVSAGKTPAVDGNTLSVGAVFENRGSAQHSLQLRGEWRNGEGRQFGGVNSSLEIAPGETAQFAAATRSAAATTMLLRVYADPAADTSQVSLISAVEETRQQIVPGYGISYTPTPTLDQIPDWPVKGVANGRDFVVQTIFFSPLHGRWEMQMSDRLFDPLEGAAFAKSQPGNEGMQTLNLYLEQRPEAGQVHQQALTFGGAMWDIRKAGSDQTTWSWNTSVSYVLEIDTAYVLPYTKGGPTFQHGGTVSGRLYVCFEGDEEGINDSFVAGEFEDVPIVYYGRPGA